LATASVTTEAGVVGEGGAPVRDGAGVGGKALADGLRVGAAPTGVRDGAGLACKLARNSFPWYWLHRKKPATPKSTMAPMAMSTLPAVWRRSVGLDI
jgi:hypothetical protein